jgi:4'-phosphopantetheinyl transferase EntD
MDVNKALRELYDEKRRIDAAIATLEAKARSGSHRLANSRRGRKSMSAEERTAVSKRMAKYWAGRRAASKALENVGTSQA